MRTIDLVRSGTRLAWAAQFIFFGFICGYAQSGQTSVVRGEIFDQNGAVIPNAVIAVSNETKSYQGTTSGKGEYSLTVVPGIYKITAEAPRLGFQTSYRSDIKAEPGIRSSVNLILYPKQYFHIDAYDATPGVVKDHPPVRVASFDYEDTPKLSESGIERGKIRFGSRCGSPSQGITRYTSGLYNDEHIGATFTYDLFTLIADEITLDSQTGIWAKGNIRIDDNGTTSQFSGSILIHIVNGKVSYERPK
jgi:hypothetical protein